MNIRLISLLAIPFVLSGCNFDEDFCIRDGELIAYAQFEDAEQYIPPYERRFVRAYGFGSDTLQTAFSQDTLRWKIPQGKYDFIFYTGNYFLVNSENYHESYLSVKTDTIDNEVKISEELQRCYTSLFNAELKYQQPVRQMLQPTSFTQRLNIKLKLNGNYKPIEKLHATLTGAATGKYLVSNNKVGLAEHTTTFKQVSENVWITTINTFGFVSSADNIFTLYIEMSGEDAIFNESQKIDLSPYLKDFNDIEKSLEMEIGVGSEIVIEEPITIPEWEDNPEIILP